MVFYRTAIYQEENCIMYYTGFADEAAPGIDDQIRATKELGWSNIESRCIDNVNIHDIPEEKFEEVCGKLADAGISINCFGSAVANWSCDPFKEEDFERSKAQLGRALVRMEKLNCKMIRGMSFRAQWKRPAWDSEVESIVFPKVQYLAKMCEDAGVLYLHENCNNYGGMSYRHTLKLLEKMNNPAFRLVFDTGNPVLNYDRSQGDELSTLQDSFVFYSNVKEFISYVHIKDGIARGETDENGFMKADFTFPGEGNANVPKIIADLLSSGYDGGFSIEPHMVKVFHGEGGDADAGYKNYVEYGKRFMRIVEDIKK